MNMYNKLILRSPLLLISVLLLVRPDLTRSEYLHQSESLAYFVILTGTSYIGEHSGESYCSSDISLDGHGARADL